MINVDSLLLNSILYHLKKNHHLHFICEQQNLQFNYFCLMIELHIFGVSFVVTYTGVVDVTLYFHH